MRSLYLVLPFLRLITATEVPIIGILSQETYSVDHLFPDDNYRSFIAASYVKYLESSGARVAPIMIGRDVDYYKNIVDHTNGILFPGGATWFNQSDGYADAGQIIYDLALEANKNGDYYPIWATCLGMELLAQVAIGGQEIRAHCSATKLSLPLEFKDDFSSSKMFGFAPEDVVTSLRKKNVTYNSHNYCFTEDIFKEYGLLDEWRVLSLNKDVNGLEFISAFESKSYPFYAIQFHPEKNRFEFKAGTSYPHSPEAVKVSQYFSNFFVEEARKNNHSYPDWQSEQDALIYNYEPMFTGLQNSSYLQLYVFKDVDENNNVVS